MPAPVNTPLIKLSPDSKLAKALKRMTLRQQLVQKFYNCEITLEELNQQLTKAGITLQYYVESGHLHVIEESLV